MNDIDVPDAGLSPLQRRVILDDQIRIMIDAGYQLVKQIDHVAIFDRGDSDRFEILIDGDGEVRYA